MLYAIYSMGDNKYQIVSSDKENKIKKRIVEYKPCLYIECENGKYKDFYGKKLKKVVFNNEFEYKAAIKEYKKSNTYFCGDIHPKYQALANNLDSISLDITPVVAYNYDIECFNLENDNYSSPNEASNPIQSITIQNMSTNKYMVFGYKDYEVTDIHRKDNNILFTVKKEDIKYVKCENERILIKKFVKLIKDNVNVITGYNILYYDNTYIINRCKKLGIEKDFVDISGGRSDELEFGNIQNIDSYPAIKKFKNDTLENNQLNTVAKAYLGYGKIEFEGSFRNLYINDYKKFMDYNIIDVALVYMLEQKLNIIKLMFNMNNRFFCNPTDTMSLTTYVDTAIYKQCLDKNIIIPCKKSNTKEPYVGGYVLEPVRGISEHSICMDIESSYPTNSRRYNISPETLVKYKDLPTEILELVLDIKFKIVREVYKEYKQYYRTKDGDLKFDKSNKKVDNSNCALHFMKDDSGKELNPAKLTYPRFFIDYNNDKFNEDESDLYFTNVGNNTRIFFIMNYNELEIYFNNREFNKDYFALYEMLVTEKLIEYYAEDHDRFKIFTNILKNNNLTMTCNLQFFKLDTFGILAKFQEDNFIERVKYKNLEKDFGYLIQYLEKGNEDELKKIKNKEIISITNIDEAKNKKELANLNNNTLKIVINGSYGFQATERSRYYNRHLGESITSSGQLCIRGIKRYLEKNNIVKSLYIDTDSLTFSPANKEILKDISNNKNDKKYIAKLLVDWFNSEVLTLINKYFNELKEYCNTRDVNINFDMETIQESVLFTDKKKYCWKLLYKDGIVFEDNKFKRKGLNFVKSDTPVWCRPKLQKFTELALTSRNPKLLKAYILKCKEVYEKQKLSVIAKPVSVKTLNDYSKGDSAIPAGVDAALNYNIFISDQKLKQYNNIVEGAKIKWIYINPNNKYGFDKIAIIDDGAINEITDFFEIDYQKQFETTFMSLPERIFEVCGWNLNKRADAFS